MHNNNWRV